MRVRLKLACDQNFVGHIIVVVTSAQVTVAATMSWSSELTFGTTLQLLLHELLLGGELAEGDLGRRFALAHCVDHLLLLLVVHFSVDVDPWDFSEAGDRL